MENDIPKYIDSKTLYKGRFISLLQNNFIKTNKDGSSSEIHWESVEYNTALEHKNQSAVQVIPIINSNPKKVILIGNYRYPVQKYVIEFPCGLIDYDKIKDKNMPLIDIIKAAGKRELKEETGYDGEFKCFFAPKSVQNNIEFTHNVYPDPWKSKESNYTCIFDIKSKGEQNLDNEEVIQVFEVELDKLLDFICQKVEKENYGVGVKVYSFAMGMQFNQLLSE